MKVLPIVWAGEKRPPLKIDKTLSQKGEEIKVVGLLIGSGQDCLELQTNITHQAKNTTSNTIIRGILKDKASVEATNSIRINKGATNANGYLSAKILLFDDARGMVTPSLEIDENEVKAGHAATVGQINDEELFYLQSRGLSLKEAKNLIIEGFFEPLLSEFPLQKREKLRKIIKKKLC